MVPAHRAGWGLKEIIHIMPSAQSLALGKSRLYLLWSLSCQPHAGFRWGSAPQRVSTRTLGRPWEFSIHPRPLPSGRLAQDAELCADRLSERFARMVSRRGTHLEILLSDSSPGHSPCSLPGPTSFLGTVEGAGVGRNWGGFWERAVDSVLPDGYTKGVEGLGPSLP